MILLKVIFNEVSFSSLSEHLEKLPEFIRPVYFSDTEEKCNKANKVINKKQFNDFLDKNSFGYFLFSKENICIDISSKNQPYITLTTYIPESHTEFVDTIFDVLSSEKVIFGLASYDPEREFDKLQGYTISCHKETNSEYEYRNRHFKKVNGFNCEAWIGLNLNKYISGLYWKTLISKEVSERFKINLHQLKENSLKYETLQNGQVLLFEFYNNPKEWKRYANKLDNLCNRLIGIFSRQEIDSKLINVDDMFLYDEIIDIENND